MLKTGKIDRVVATLENRKQIFISVYYESGRIVKYYNPFTTIPESVKHYMYNAYIYFISPCEKLYKANHD